MGVHVQIFYFGVPKRIKTDPELPSRSERFRQFRREQSIEHI